ncbi:MAG: molybdopterin-dependent oxidoreductase [Acidiferrobacterales bacterium]|nr:molybdopterin-dependent oxidoreductase [Acidiferrobacterales bacterium]
MSTAKTAQILDSVCPLDCPDTCSLEVTVAKDRIVKVRGSKANPYTAGVICNKVGRYYPEMVHGGKRLRNPLIRTGERNSGQYRRISWDDALEHVHRGFSRAIDEFGPQSVMPLNYAGPHGELAIGSMDRRFFHKLGATLVDRGPLCGAVRTTSYSSLYGEAPGMAPEHARHSDLIVVWGNNATVSNLHLARVIKSARESGAKVITVDPKRIRIAEQSDLHIHIMPGTDVIFAMAVAAQLERQDQLDLDFIMEWTFGYERYMDQARQYSIDDVIQICGISKNQFDQFIQLYSNAKNIAVSVGNGMERGHSGGSGIRAAMALQALTGNHGRIGAGVIAEPDLTVPRTTDRLRRPDLIPSGTRTFNIVDTSALLLDETLDPPIKALMIYNHNPVATHPNQQQMIEALERQDLFIVGSDIVMTDSMAYADVILPAASHFEYADIYGAYGQNYVQRAAPVIPLVGEALPNTEIFRRLAAKFDFEDAIFTESDSELMDSAFDPDDSRFEGSRPSELPLDRAIEFNQPDGEFAIMCDNVRPATASGKIELFSEDLEQRFGFGVPRYRPVSKDLPFVLISPSSSKRTNATFGGCAASDGMEIVEINPQDAETHAIADGDVVEVFNERGKAVLKIVVSDKTRPGVLYSPKGTWRNTSHTNMTVNALIPSDIRADLVGGACYNETFVDLKRQM